VSTITQTPEPKAAPATAPEECWSCKHLDWLADTGERLKTADGKVIEVWEFKHEADEAVLSAWAKHFRNHYCPDKDIDFLRGSRSRKSYLDEIKFPSKTSKLGPSVRAGDFGEILVADYLQFILGYSVPRVRWGSKIVRDESSKGSDVIGFYFHGKNGNSSEDALAVFEAKTRFSGSSGSNRLQDAINDSAKDPVRIAESLNYIKQRFFEKGEKGEAKKIERFQTPVDSPYRELFGAAALYSHDQFDAKEICNADCQKVPESSKRTKVKSHPKADVLTLIVIKGTDMMSLVHDLYRRAADEA
jgi:hypothetical protein